MTVHATNDLEEQINEIEAGGELPLTHSGEPLVYRPKGFLRQSLQYTRTWVGIAIVSAIVLLAIFGGLFAPHSPYVFVGSPFSGGTSSAPLGADYLGRDVLSRFLSGGHYILVLAALGTLFGVGTGTVIGLTAGYLRNFVDEMLMRTMDLILCFPGLVLALLVITALGPHLWLIVVVVAVTFVPNSARVVRSVSIQVSQSDYVKYAEANGMPLWRILLKEILPNITAPLTVEFGIRFINAIGLIAGLDYLGLGVQAPAPDWGLMLEENQVGLTVRPLAVILPLLMIALLAVGMNLIADGIGQAAAGTNRAVEG
jgi:peptide/nickel transport system permease protein